MTSKKQVAWFPPTESQRVNKSYSGLSEKPQEVRPSRKFSLASISLTLLSHHCSSGCRSSPPHAVPSATTMDLEEGWGGQARGVG